MRTALVLLLLVLSTSVASADRWTATDTAVQAVVGAALAVDYVQTRRICYDPIDPNRRESNPVMGREGERVPPELYFAGVAALHTAAVVLLPQPYRRIAQGAMLVVQVDAVSANWQAGYSLSF